jgi:hypothetical protein
VDRPLAWRIEIDGGYSPTALKTLLGLQLAGRPHLNVYPPSVEILPPESADGATPRLAVTLHALPDQTGSLVFPELALPWFDPADGRLRGLVLPGRTVEIGNPLHARLWRAGLGALGLISLAGLARIAHRSLRWRLARRRALAAVAQASDLPALRLAVRGFSLAPDDPPAATLGSWRGTRALRGEGLDGLIRALDEAGYGRNPADPAALQAEALRVLARARPGHGRDG